MKVEIHKTSEEITELVIINNYNNDEMKIKSNYALKVILE